MSIEALFLDSSRFSPTSKSYLTDYEKTAEDSKKKEIIEKIIKLEKNCLKEHNDPLRKMENTYHSRFAQYLLTTLFLLGVTIGIGYFVFTFFAGALIVLAPIFLAACFGCLLSCAKVFETGLPSHKFDQFTKVSLDKKQLITALETALEKVKCSLRSPAALEASNVDDSAEAKVDDFVCPVNRNTLFVVEKPSADGISTEQQNNAPILR